jgi:hypothetical protein
MKSQSNTSYNIPRELDKKITWIGPFCCRYSCQMTSVIGGNSGVQTRSLIAGICVGAIGALTSMMIINRYTTRKRNTNTTTTTPTSTRVTTAPSCLPSTSSPVVATPNTTDTKSSSLLDFLLIVGQLKVNATSNHCALIYMTC